MTIKTRTVEEPKSIVDKEEVYVCERCGFDVPKEESVYVPVGAEWEKVQTAISSWENLQLNPEDEFVYCRDCAESIFGMAPESTGGWLKAHVERATEEIPDPPALLKEFAAVGILMAALQFIFFGLLPGLTGTVQYVAVSMFLLALAQGVMGIFTFMAK